MKKLFYNSLKRFDSYLIEPGFYPEGAIVFVIGGEYVFFHGIKNEFFIWFSSIPSDTRIESVLNRLPSGELDTLGSGVSGSYAQMMQVLLDDIKRY